MPAEAGLPAPGGTDGQGRLEQPVQHGPGLGARHLPRLSHLTLDLGLPQDHRVEPRGDPVEVAHGLAVPLHVSVFLGGAAGAKALRQQLPYGLGHGAARLREVELRAVTGGEQDTPARARAQHPLQGRRDFVRRVSEPLANLERRRAVVHPQDRDAHAPIVFRGSVPFPARRASAPSRPGRPPRSRRCSRTPRAYPPTPPPPRPPPPPPAPPPGAPTPPTGPP